MLGKILRQLLQDGDCGIVLFPHAKNDFVVGIILPAEAGKVFVGTRVQPANWLQDTYRRRKTRIDCAPRRRTAKEIPDAEQRNRIIDEGDRGDGQNPVAGKRDHWAPRAPETNRDRETSRSSL